MTIDIDVNILVKQLSGLSNVLSSRALDSRSADITVKDPDLASKDIMDICLAIGAVIHELRRERLSSIFEEE